MPVVIKLKGMPWQTTVRDVKTFFRDSKLTDSDVHLATNETGRPCGIGFACFYDDEDARRAMERNGAYIGKRYVELFLSSQTEMERTLREGVPTPTTTKLPAGQGNRAGGSSESRRRSRDRSRSPIDRHNRSDRGSYGAATRSGINGRGGDGNESAYRGSGRGRGVFGRGARGSRGRGVFRGGRGAHSFTTMHSQDSSRDFRSQRDPSIERSNNHPKSGSSALGSNDKGLFLKLRGMPYSAKDEDILLFLKGINIAAVYIIPNKEGKYAGKSSGSAFIECATQDDCARALKRNGKFLGNRYIHVVKCTLEDIVSTLNIDMNLLSGSFHGETRDGGGKSFGSSAYSSNRREPVEVDTSLSMVAESANINLADIKDGCVVGIRNLPVTTTPDDILLLFKDFPAIPDSVRIHYIDANRCSGDAMITLVSNEHARSAIRQLSGKQLGGRKIELFLL